MYAINNFKHFFNQDKFILKDNIFPVLIKRKSNLFWKTIYSDSFTKLKTIPSFFKLQTLFFLGEECHNLAFNKYFRFTSHRSYSGQLNLTKLLKLP